MILVDTAVWIDHLHASEPRLVSSLEDGLVVQHPMIIGEIALGSLRDRAAVVTLLTALPSVVPADHDEVLMLVEKASLHGRGLSLVDAHLLTALRLSPGIALWTRDVRLREAAAALDIAAIHR